MNDHLTRLFESSSTAPGALGCGVRLPDRTSRVCSYHKDYPNESLEKMLLHLANATALMASHDLAGHQLIWKFTNGRMFVATRSDGALFCLVTRAGVGAGEFFDQMTAQFIATT